ncbi:S8 family peptidase [Kocuria rosea]|uniref:S8 family peptidase n=1 Tax=Kocuria rosea TaxID=1275 RepID=UPI0009E8DD75|nr:S8 family peptidase [Kocuria polaris]
MLDSRLKFLNTLKEQDGSEKIFSTLESTGRFGLVSEEELRVRILVQVDGVRDTELREHGLRINTRAGDVISGDIALSSVESLGNVEGVVLVEAARPMAFELDISLPETRANLVHQSPPGHRGAGVILGIIDSGIDWMHPCFRDGAGNSRVLRIWDQTLFPLAGEISPAQFNYGVEYQQGQIDFALATANSRNTIRSMDGPSGHGTHVTGVAAGDGSAAGNGVPPFNFVGVAPEADIIIVTNQVTTEAFGDSATTLDAIQYIYSVAQTFGRPAVINISQGDNLSAHDGTALLERGIDNLLGGGGRALVKSAGNAANGGVHASGTVNTDSTSAIQFIVPESDKTPDTLDFWYKATDRIGFALKPPSGTETEAIAPGTSATLAMDNGNRVFVDSVVNYPNNGDNRIYVQLHPGAAPSVESGTWTVKLIGDSVVDGVWHGWIERGTTVPEFIGEYRNDKVTISIPGTSTEVITVGSYITKGSGTGNLSTFSSRGPTRDGRSAPTIAAPGQAILSANSGASSSDMQYISMSGTSMASPHVAGAVALMLQASPTLTQREVINRLVGAARDDNFTGNVPNNDWGAGKLDAFGSSRQLSDEVQAELYALRNENNELRREVDIVRGRIARYSKNDTYQE